MHDTCIEPEPVERTNTFTARLNYYFFIFFFCLGVRESAARHHSQANKKTTHLKNPLENHGDSFEKILEIST
jgi:hypothetical protein